MPPDQQEHEVVLQAPRPGLYRVNISDRMMGVRVRWTPGMPVAMPSSLDARPVFGGRWNSYFYVPKGTKSVGGFAFGGGRVMDAHLGMQLNPGMGDYKIPGSLEMPELVPLIDDDDKREAVIGIAEGCIIPAVGALANAVFNATGVRVRELPITPDKILMGLTNTNVISRG